MDKKRNLFENNKFLLLLSFAIASFLWLYVIVYVNNQHTTTIRNVPINLQYMQSSYQELGLEVIEQDITEVSVSVTGPRSTTGKLNASDIIVYPKITGITSPGTYVLTLTAENLSAVNDFTINSISNNHVNVRFDRVLTKDFDVGIDISNVTVAEDFIAGVANASPKILTITGPEHKLETISKVVAVSFQAENLSKTTILKSTFKLFDENDAEISKDLLTFSNEEVEISIPVLREKTLPIKVDFVNIPTGFDVDTLNLKLSVEEITVAIPSNQADNVDDFVVGYIDLQTLETDKAYEFNIELPNGYIMLSDANKVTATVPSTGLVEKKVAVSEIKVINDAENKIEVSTQVINDVIIIGEQSAVDGLSVGSVIAQIDASTLSLAQGKQTIQATFIIPGSSKVYVKGVYNVTVGN